MLKNYNSQSEISIIKLNEEDSNTIKDGNLPSNKIKTLTISDDNNDDNDSNTDEEESNDEESNDNESVNNEKNKNDINTSDINIDDNEEETSTIKIFSRIRPAKYKIPNRYWITKPEEDILNDDKPLPKIGFLIPRSESQGLINNQKEKHEFKFDRVFDKDTKQEEIFDVVAKDVVLR